jgi:haloalkane dehalogenase
MFDASRFHARPTGRRALLAGAAALTGGALLSPAIDVAGAPAANADDPTSAEAAKILRTPPERFDGLPGYRFEPHYAYVDLGEGSDTRLRMHYVDERPDPAKASGETILLIHGNPTWSYLYRNVIPQLVAAGHRCIAIDLIGFGKSDKLVNRFAYTYASHVDWISQAVVERLKLSNITLVCHDWGGILGMLLLARHPERFRRAVASNTTGPREGGADLGPGWEYLAKWLQFTQRTQQLESAQVVEEFTLSTLDPAVRTAYNAPYPNDTFLHGVRRFAVLIPITAYDEANPMIREAWQTLSGLQTPFLALFSAQDHVTRGDTAILTNRIPGAQGITLSDAAHFVQEDKPTEFAAAVNDFIRSTT